MVGVCQSIMLVKTDICKERAITEQLSEEVPEASQGESNGSLT